jgi:hypothetical protein
MFTTLVVILISIVVIAIIMAVVKVARIKTNPNNQRFETSGKRMIKTQNGWIWK